MKIGSALPNLKLPATGEKSLNFRDFKGKNLIVYFYPKDNTPGCTTEGKDFTRLYADFQKADAEIVGISKDSVKKHENFCEKYGFPFDLLADEEEKACTTFDVIKEKSMYGKKYMGIERSTFLFGKDGKLKHEWRKVSVKGHAEEVLAAVQAL